jgi:hypothetical protein
MMRQREEEDSFLKDEEEQSELESSHFLAKRK